SSREPGSLPAVPAREIIRRPMNKEKRLMTIAPAIPAAYLLALAAGNGSLLAAEAKPPAAATAAAKKESEGPLQNMKFRNLGPAVGGGRVTAVAGGPGDPNVIYVGAAAGGAWKRGDSRGSFQPHFAQYPSSISASTLA